MTPAYEESKNQGRERESRPAGKPDGDHLPGTTLPGLADIVDMQAIQSLMNHFYALTHIGIAILDLKGNILVATGWQDICVQFHRVHPETCKNCLDSDLILSNGIAPGTFKLYRCKNHMWDMATPIMAGTVKVGNLFLGQFLFEDDVLDISTFRKQARQYGFDEIKYLSALEKVPRWSRETVDEVMGFYTKLANLISDQGYRNVLLNRSEARFRTIFESTTDCVFLKDSQLCYTMVNPAMARLFDKTPEELIGTTDKELFGEKAAEHLTQTDTRVLNGKTIDEEDTKPVRGVPTTFHVKKMPVWGSDGSIAGLCGIARDITRQKKAEKALHASRQNLENIIEHLPVGIGILDDKGHILRINQQFKKMFGYTENDISTIENWAVNAYPDKDYRKTVLKIWDQYVRKVFDTGVNTPPVDVEITCKDKTTRNILISLQPGNNQHLTTFVDITERKRAEAAFKSQNALLSTIMKTSPVGITLVDAEGSITYANCQAEQILGIEQNKITARRYDSPEWRHTDIHGKPFPDEKQPFYIVKTTGKPVYDIQHGIIWPDGRSVILSINASPIKNKEGQFAGMVATFEDITDRKRAEEEREKLQDQLKQAQKMESVGRLAGGVAHDFNNMLNVILGQTDMIIEDLPADSPLLSDLGEIKKAAERSADLTRQLLAFARKQTVAPEVLDLNETIASMLKMLERLIGEDIDLIWTPGRQIAPVHIDPGQVNQMLVNLCINARDAIGHRSGKIIIETMRARFDDGHFTGHLGFPPGDCIMLAVSDTGPGMDEQTRSQIFEPFFTTKSTGQGTGLGLATVYGIVKQNNGFITVYSEPDQGTVFKIYLPGHQATSSLLPEKAPHTPGKCGHETVLLIEDEPAILKMAAMMLEREGYTVVKAGTPGEAIRLATEHAGDIHLLITDVVMPEMNGRDLAKHILSLYPEMKCLFMSGYTADIIAHHGVLEKGVNFIQKPFSKSDLAVKMREILD